MKKILFLISAILLIFLVSACKDKEMGIFYSIEQEKILDDNTIPNSATIGSLVKLGETYYAALGILYSVNAEENFQYHIDGSTGEWSKAAMPPDTLCTSLGVVDGSLYGVFYEEPSPADPADFDSRLYVLSGSDWNLVTEAETLVIEKMAVANNVAFLLSYTLDGSDNRTYSLSTWNGTTLTSTPLTGLLQYGNLDAAWDGSDYWISYGFSLYTSPAANPETLTDATATGLPDGNDVDTDKITGIHYSVAYGRLLIALNGGAIYYLDGTWQALDDKVSQPSDFADFRPDGGTTDYLLIGSSNGYYEYTGASPLTTAADFILPEDTAVQDTYLTLDLRTAGVTGFFTDTTLDGDEVLFALTAGNGLWGNRLYTTGERRWGRE